MTPFTLNSLNPPPGATAAAGSGARRRNPSDAGRPFVGVRLSSGVQGTARSEESGGLARIERKGVVNPWARPAAVKGAGALASVWIAIPFVTVFVMGCLTLA